MVRLAILLVAAGAALANTTTPCTNIVMDGDFEDGCGDGTNWPLFDQNVSENGAYGRRDRLPEFDKNKTEFAKKTCRLHTHCFWLSDLSSPGGVQQTLATTENTTYTLTFKLWGAARKHLHHRQHPGSRRKWALIRDNLTACAETTCENFSSDPTGAREVEMSFTANSTATLLTFWSAANVCMDIDDVVVSACNQTNATRRMVWRMSPSTSSSTAPGHPPDEVDGSDDNQADSDAEEYSEQNQTALLLDEGTVAEVHVVMQLEIVVENPEALWQDADSKANLANMIQNTVSEKLGVPHDDIEVILTVGRRKTAMRRLASLITFEIVVRTEEVEAAVATLETFGSVDEMEQLVMEVNKILVVDGQEVVLTVVSVKVQHVVHELNESTPMPDELFNNTGSVLTLTDELGDAQDHASPSISLASTTAIVFFWCLHGL